jgi:SPP1 gp7 family putative phage head morphogenesis protein
MPGPDPLVVQTMREFKRLLRAREYAQMTAMAERWLQVNDALEAEINGLAQDFEDRRREGRSISQAALYRMDRWQSLRRQALQQFELYEDYADAAIAQGQREFAQLAIDHAAQAIGLQYEGVGAFFDRLPVEAVENMIGLAGDGSPLHELLSAGWGDGVAGLTRELVNSTALGRGPRETARRMQRGMAQGLNRALTIARTEQHRVYRNAAQQQYAASGVVYGHRRLATHDDRVCPACLAAEGELLDVNEPLYDHPNGRCTSIPLVDGLPEVEFENGPTWFARQDADTQRRILGPARYRLYQQGASIEGMFERVEDDTWGPSLQPMSSSLLEVVSGGFDADRRYRTTDELRNKRALMFARRNTPEAMWNEAVENESTEFMYGFFQLDPATAEPGFNGDLVLEAKSNLLLDIYRLGGGDLPEDMLRDIRQRAAGIVSADEWMGGGLFTRKERNILRGLVSEYDEDVMHQVDKIRDRRQRGEIANIREQRTRVRSSKTSEEARFVTAAQADAQQFMMDWNARR